nr:unnamed protein product [Callosobruchus analis]
MWYSFNSVVFLVSSLLVLLDSADGQAKNQNGKIIYPSDEFTDNHNLQHNYHEGFQHSPEFHRSAVLPPGFQHSPEFHRNDGKCCGQAGSAEQTRSNAPSSTNQHKNVGLTDIGITPGGNTSLQYVVDDDDVATLVVRNRFGDEPRSKYQGGEDAARIPRPAGCQPERVSVKLGSDTDSSILYMPPCTRIEKCGGCCSHPLLECQPTEVKTMSFEVKKTKYSPGVHKLKVVSKEVVLVEKHEACKCGCKIKAKDCNKYQEYREAECACVCVNLDEENKCTKDPQKLWNPKICGCECRNLQECTTGYIFNQQECKCLPIAHKRRIIPEQIAESSYYDKYY